MLRRALVGVGLGLSAALVALLFGTTELAGRFEDATYDLRVRRTAQPVAQPSPVVVVEINETSIRNLEPLLGRWPWPRLIHASVIDYLKLGGAAAIVYDVVFAEADSRTSFEIANQRISGEQSDEQLIRSVRDAGNVILAADPSSEGLRSTRAESVDGLVLPGVAYAPGEGFQERVSMTPPFRRLMAASAGLGHTLLVKETDGSARRALPFITNRGVAVPSLGLAGALLFLHLGPDDVRLEGNTLRLGTTRMPVLDRTVPPADGTSGPLPSRQVLLRFPAPTTGADQVRSLVPTYSVGDVLISGDTLSSGGKPVIDPSVFKDKVVFVGIRIANTNENFTTPFGADAVYGVELHAVLAHNVLTGQFMRRAAARTDVGLTLILALTAGLVATMVPAVWATGVVVAMVAALVVWLTRDVGAARWVGLAVPSVAAALALFSGVAWQYLVEGRAKRHVRQLFGRFVSKDVIAQLMDDPALAQLGGHRREMTVLFSDIRGFTTASEKGTPEAVVAQLNEYFSAMVDVLFRHHGTLDKFVGDMVMGLFGAPLADPRHADHAVQAAREMTVELERLNSRWREEGRPELDIGIGINTGEMIAGNIGSASIMSYTVIGDAVNLGSRIESLNKDYGTRILISGETKAALTIPVETREIGEVKVKGRSRVVMIYEVK